MSAYLRIWGLKIYLDARYTEDTSIGLYTPPVSGNSEIRLIENDIANLVSEVGETWKYGLLGPDAFGSIKESSNLKRGGNISIIHSTEVVLDNTIQFDKTIADNEIKITGRKAEIWEFEVNQSDDSITTYVMGYGDCEDPIWTETDYTIPIKDSNFKRNAAMGTKLNSEEYELEEDSQQIGKMIPVTYGEWKEMPAKFIRIADKSSLSRMVFLPIVTTISCPWGSNATANAAGACMRSQIAARTDSRN